MKYPSTAVLALAALLSGCGGAQAAPPQDDSACREIGQACHGADSGQGEAHECHVSAHATWSPAECADHRDHCLSVCAASGEATHHEASGAQTSDDGTGDQSGS